MQDLYAENTVTRNQSVHELEDSVSFRCPSSPQLIYKLNPNPVKIQAVIFVDVDKLILKFTWECRRIKVTNSFEEKQSLKSQANTF